MSSTPTTFDQIKTIIQLPTMAAIIVPGIIHYFTNGRSVIPLDKLNSSLIFGIGIALLLIGLLIFMKSVQLFIKIGNGTLAPWNPTKNIVIKSLYRYVRNPMLIGVNIFIVGEALLLKNGNILLWVIFFLVLNTIYFIYSEEPGLRKRFGKEYDDYCKHVPRWFPRFTPYYPEGETQLDQTA